MHVFILECSREIVDALLAASRHHSSGRRIEQLVGWDRPPDGWVKLNTDGTSRGNPRAAAAGACGVMSLRNGFAGSRLILVLVQPLWLNCGGLFMGCRLLGTVDGVGFVWSLISC